jgi:hypothetical protein
LKYPRKSKSAQQIAKREKVRETIRFDDRKSTDELLRSFSYEMAVSNAKGKSRSAIHVWKHKGNKSRKTIFLKVHNIHRHLQEKHEQLLLPIFGREIA